jgi:hypothetical protein
MHLIYNLASHLFNILKVLFRFLYILLRKIKRSRSTDGVRLQEKNVISRFKKPTGIWAFSSDDIAAFCFFRGGSSSYRADAELLEEGNVDSIEFVIFDFVSLFTDFGEYEGFGIGTAILLQSDNLNLPPFKWDHSLNRVRSISAINGNEGPKQCPWCGNWDVRWAYIEDGGMGHWCPDCRKSCSRINEEKASQLIEIYKMLAEPRASDMRLLTESWLVVIGSNTQLLMHVREKQLISRDIQRFTEEALTVFRVFQAASKSTNEALDRGCGL